MAEICIGECLLVDVCDDDNNGVAGWKMRAWEPEAINMAELPSEAKETKIDRV